jgi:hypothetical protein
MAEIGVVHPRISTGIFQFSAGGIRVEIFQVKGQQGIVEAYFSYRYIFYSIKNGGPFNERQEARKMMAARAATRYFAMGAKYNLSEYLTNRRLLNLPVCLRKPAS